MYHALLTNRYLTSRVIPLVAVGAVALCVALVIVVVSIMTGFLEMVRSSGRTLMGDVVISYPVTGVPHYERLIQRLDTLPEVAAATPVVDCFGLLKMPYPEGPDKQVRTVQVWGIEPTGFARVTGFENTLHWKTVETDQRRWLLASVIGRYWTDIRSWMTDEQKAKFVHKVLSHGNREPVSEPGSQAFETFMQSLDDTRWRHLFDATESNPEWLEVVLGEELWNRVLSFDDRLSNPDQVFEDGLRLRRGNEQGIVLGMHVSEGNERQSDGTYKAALRGFWWMPRFSVTLTTLPISGGGLSSEPESVILPVVNEYISGVYLIDDTRVMVPISVAQRLLHLDEGEIVDEADPTQVIGEDPEKATMILVRAADGVHPNELRPAVEDAYEEFWNELQADESAVVKPPSFGFGLSIKTWEEQQAQFIAPVEKERELMRTLFSIVYLVCAGLVLSIFWAIVYEKTRDIGILRSIGGSRGGIVWIFLRYGLIVGCIGAVIGLGLAYGIIRNINSIHDGLAEPPILLAVAAFILTGVAILTTIITSMRGHLLPLVLGSLVSVVLLAIAIGILLLNQSGGIVIWDPAVYYFSTVPNDMDVYSAVITMIGAVVFSLIGAAVPAAKAADIDPVQALRYE